MKTNKYNARFEDNHIHSNYSDDATCSLEEIFEYNNTHDKLNIVISDHVDRHTVWFDRYANNIKSLRNKYPDFSTRIGCEVKIIDESGSLNTTDEILDKAEVVLGSVHNFPKIQSMSPDEVLEREFILTKILASNDKIDILAHPFSMSYRLHRLSPPVEYVQEVYDLCVKNNIKFEYSSKYSLGTINSFVKREMAMGNVNNFSFGSDMHENCSEIGSSTFAIFDPVNILVTGCGAAIAQSIIKAIKLSKINTRIVAVDSSPLAAGLYRANSAYLVPHANKKGYAEEIIRICNKENIDLILVGTDIELPVLASSKDMIESATNARVIISPMDAISITDDKWRTIEFLKENGWVHPQSSLVKDIKTLSQELGYPMVVKPRFGFRAIGFNIVHNEKELRETMAKTDNPIFQEYLPNDDAEYTCTGFFYHGKCYGIIILKRELRNGDTYKAVVERDAELENFLEDVGIRLGVYGSCNFQLRKTENGPKIFEINCRFSGTTGTVSFIGFNVINALMQHLFFGRRLIKLSCKEARMLRYWNEVFIDELTYMSLRDHRYLDQPNSDLNIF